MHQAGKIWPNQVVNAETCPMSGKQSLSTAHLRIHFEKCLNAFLNRIGLKHKRVSFNLDYGADTIAKARIVCLNIKSQSVSSSE